MKGRMSHDALARAESNAAEAKEEREERGAEHRKGGRVQRRRHGGKVEGKHPPHRLDKRARGGKWIADATEHAHGQFSAKAKRAGMSTAAFAEKEEHAPGRLGKEARLAENLTKARKGKG